MLGFLSQRPKYPKAIQLQLKTFHIFDAGLGYEIVPTHTVQIFPFHFIQSFSISCSKPKKHLPVQSEQ